MRLSTESRIQKIEKGLKTDKELTHHDRLMIDYRLTQIEYGFDTEGEAAFEIMGWIEKLGKTKWDRVMKELTKRTVSKDKQADNPFSWKRLVNHE